MEALDGGAFPLQEGRENVGGREHMVGEGAHVTVLGQGGHTPVVDIVVAPATPLPLEGAHGAPALDTLGRRVGILPVVVETV